MSKSVFGFGADPIVIRNYVAGFQGGKVLDVTGYSEKYIRAGHLIIRDKKEDVYKPMPVSGEVYASLPSGHEYVGVCVASVLTSEPHVAIMYSGEVNDKASPYPVDSLLSAIKSDVPTLVFQHD